MSFSNITLNYDPVTPKQSLWTLIKENKAGAHGGGHTQTQTVVNTETPTQCEKEVVILAQIFKPHLKKSVSSTSLFLSKPLIDLYTITIGDHGVDCNGDWE